MDMLRYIRSKIPASSHGGSRQKDAEYFRFQKTIQYGFPSKATCMAYDTQLSLLAIGTKNGQVRIYGAPGVEFGGQHEGDKSVQRLLFLHGQGRIVSFCEDQSFHLWEINFRDGQGHLDHVKECSASGKMKRVSCCAIKQEQNGDAAILIGTEIGNVYACDVRTFELTDHVIYQDAVMQNIPDDYKLSPGAVEALAVHPKEPNKLLIGYNRGLIVLWDSATSSARQTFVAPQQVDSLAWLRRNEKFISSHNDGSYIVWSTNSGSQAALSKPDVASTMPFGPFPCKPIDKILFKTTDEFDDEYIIWTGGMPRASYGDRHTVAIQRKEKQVVFDFNTKVMDFLTVDSALYQGDEYEEVDSPKALLVLCEEELVAIDLDSHDWPAFQLPYLQPLHASPITACLHVSDVARESIYDKLVQYGRDQAKSSKSCQYSEKPWPIQGGENKFHGKHPTDLLITGHEDGSVKFWSAGDSTMTLLYVLPTAKLFDGYNDPNEFPTAEEDWPPFRKVGCYDPFSDDPRFGIQRLVFDAKDGVLLVAGAAGQATVWTLNEDKVDAELQMIIADLASDTENFVWKGKERLELRNGGKSTFTPGFAPTAVLQMNPPASVTALALQSSWGVAAIGTAHGYALFDYKVGKATFKKCLLSPAEMTSGIATAAEGTMSRFKSFKKSLRESFRRRRGGGRSPKSTSPEPPKTIDEVPALSEQAAAASASASPATAPKVEIPKESSPKREKKTPSPIEEAHSPLRVVEREVKDRAETSELNSMVRAMYFCQTYILNASTLSPTLWIGTNGGTIIALTLTIPETSEQREQSGGVQCQLAKEVHLRHRAPVLALTVVDGQGFPLDNPKPVAVMPPTHTLSMTPATTAEATVAAAPSTEPTVEPVAPTVATPAIPAPAPTPVVASPSPASSHDHGHRLIVCSEEQIKAFHLCTLKPSRYKFKLTATEGSRIRKVQFINLQSKSDENRWEPFIAVMTNQGEVNTFDTHHFRRYLHQNCLPSADVSGILSTVLTRHGEGFYLLSSSEWQRFSVGQRNAVVTTCSLDIADGARPPLATATSPEAAAAADAVQELKLDEAQVEDQHAAGEGGAGATGSGAADTSAMSGGGESLNASTLPSDVTMDSIRDYTTHHVSTESHVTDKGTVTITEKVTKTVHTIGSGGAATVVKQTKVEENITNGNNGEEADEIALAKKLVSSTQESKTVTSHHHYSSSTATAE